MTVSTFSPYLRQAINLQYGCCSVNDSSWEAAEKTQCFVLMYLTRKRNPRTLYFKS
jgi:hypothetical protein